MMRIRGRRLVYALVGLALVIAVAGAYLRQFITPVLVAGPMLQAVGPTEFTVVWRTVVDEPGHVVLLTEGKARPVPAMLQDGRQVARVDGLAPNTVYHYVVRHQPTFGEAQELASGTARTTTTADAPFTFLVFGDSGSGSNSQTNLANEMLRFEPDFILHTGDLIYPSGEPEHYRSRFFVPYFDLLRTAFFYPSLGNHDVKTDDGTPLLETFVLPENGPPGMTAERCYFFEYGNARFVAIDSTREWDELREVVAPWLAGVLNDTETTWKFAFFHHPPYTNSKHDPDRKMQETLVPTLEAGGVDVVFCGHNHLYERTAPIRAGRVAPDGEGVVYVVTGAGGASKYAEREATVDYIDVYNHDAFSFTVVEIDGPTLHLRQIDIRGRTIDDWSYTKTPPTGPAENGPID